MSGRKPAKKYYFSVEGQTEMWYLKWLEKEINSAAASLWKVVFDCKVEKNPVSRVKSLTITEKTEIFHIIDVEGTGQDDISNFERALDHMKAAEKLGKNVKYSLAYNNLTFELWMILHKKDLRGPVQDKKQYLKPINEAFGENFQSLSEFKREDNFKKCLDKLSLSDVCSAIDHAGDIMRQNEENGCKLKQHGSYKYYEENPSLLSWEAINKVMTDCGLKAN
ncbi:MAG: RloB family protein [Lachnospiraceae bacterium]|nr:RloB family protein [Lachnospiraceae bacterium]